MEMRSGKMTSSAASIRSLHEQETHDAPTEPATPPLPELSPQVTASEALDARQSQVELWHRAARCGRVYARSRHRSVRVVTQTRRTRLTHRVHSKLFPSHPQPLPCICNVYILKYNCDLLSEVKLRRRNLVDIISTLFCRFNVAWSLSRRLSSLSYDHCIRIVVVSESQYHLVISLFFSPSSYRRCISVHYQFISYFIIKLR